MRALAQVNFAGGEFHLRQPERGKFKQTNCKFGYILEVSFLFHKIQIKIVQAETELREKQKKSAREKEKNISMWLSCTSLI